MDGVLIAAAAPGIAWGSPTGVALRAGIGVQIVRVAGLAAAGATVMQVKVVRQVKQGRGPATGIMARGAI